MYLNPLEQFEVIPLLPLESGSGFFDFTITNFVIFLFFNFVLVVGVLFLAIFKSSLIPTRFQSVIEELYLFVIDTVKQQAGVTGAKFSVFFFYYFFIYFACEFVRISSFLFYYD